MPRINLKADNLNEINKTFAHTPLEEPIFLNSIPKSGSHLMRNIMRLFVPLEQHYKNSFIQYASMKADKAAWNPAKPTLSWGHLFFSDDGSILLHKTRKLLLVRDPYDWVLARARFFMSDEFEGNLDHLKTGHVTVEELLNMMIFGIHRKVPMMAEIYLHNGVAWMGTDAHILRFEDLLHHVKNLDDDAAEDFFRDLITDKLGIPLPDDWRERVREGSDRKHSGTARENLTNTKLDIPGELPDIQKKLVDFALPGIRDLMGYK